MDEEDDKFDIRVATKEDIRYAGIISETMEQSAVARGTGIAKRSVEKICHYIIDGNAVIAVHKDGRWAGFCYLGVWDNGALVSNSGLIVAPEFRAMGIANKLKARLLSLSNEKYPDADVVGITTGFPVMKINTSLGFYPTTFSEMPKDEGFWDGCKSCVNHDILMRTEKKFCLCTAMRLTRLKREKSTTNGVASSLQITPDFV